MEEASKSGGRELSKKELAAQYDQRYQEWLDAYEARSAGSEDPEVADTRR